MMRTEFFDGPHLPRDPGVLVQGAICSAPAWDTLRPGLSVQERNRAFAQFDARGAWPWRIAARTPMTHTSSLPKRLPSFDGKYTIWGQCENLDVVKAIARVPRDVGDMPVTPLHTSADR